MSAPLALVLALACTNAPGEPSETISRPEPAQPAPMATEQPAAAEPADPDGLALARAKGAAQQMGKTLKARVMASMAASGPAATIDVCRVEAPQMAATIRESSGTRVGRSSLRLRNPANVAPDWVATWMAEQGERPAEGVEGIARIDTVTEADGTTHREARFLAPIAVEAPCLACHGPPESYDPDLTARLASQYPDDRATGYAVGDLRGVLWAASAVD